MSERHYVERHDEQLPTTCRVPDGRGGVARGGGALSHRRAPARGCPDCHVRIERGGPDGAVAARAGWGARPVARHGVHGLCRSPADRGTARPPTPAPEGLLLRDARLRHGGHECSAQVGAPPRPPWAAGANWDPSHRGGQCRPRGRTARADGHRRGQTPSARPTGSRHPGAPGPVRGGGAPTRPDSGGGDAPLEERNADPPGDAAGEGGP